MCIVCGKVCGPLNGETKSWRCAGLLSKWRPAIQREQAKYDSLGKRKARNLVVELARISCQSVLDFNGGGRSAEEFVAAGLEVTSAETIRKLWPAMDWHAQMTGYRPFHGRAERVPGEFDLVFADYTGGASQKTRRSLQKIVPRVGKWLAVTLAPDHQLDLALAGPSAAATIPAWLQEATGLDLEYIGRYVRNEQHQTMWIAMLSRPVRRRGNQQLAILTTAREIRRRNYWATPAFRSMFPNLVKHRSHSATDAQKTKERARREAKRDELIVARRTWYYANREAILARNRANRTPEKSREYEKRYREKHYEEVLARSRSPERVSYRRAWYLAHREEQIASSKAWREAHAKPRIEKTHCPSGHPYSGRNLGIDHEGYRLCRTCRATQQRLRREGKKAA